MRQFDQAMLRSQGLVPVGNADQPNTFAKGNAMSVELVNIYRSTFPG